MKILFAISVIYMSLGVVSNSQTNTVAKKAKIKVKSCPPNSSPSCKSRPKFS